MLDPGQKKDEEDWETEPLLECTQDGQDTEAAQLSAKSCSRSARCKRVAKLGCLLTFGVALLTTVFIVIPHCFWLSFKHFGPGEPNGLPVLRPKDVVCKNHAQWWDSNVVEHHRRWSSFTNLTVPLNEDGLSILVEGGVYGSVDFVEDDSLVNEAYVDFYVEFHSLRKSTFCALEGVHDSSSGIGIFAPKNPGKGKTMMVKLTVRLPKTEALKMKKMRIVVPDMQVNFHSKIKPNILSVTSRKALSHISNVECDSCDFRVSDGPISGNFTVRRQLILKTKSGAIDADITMISNTTGVQGEPSVYITTTTGAINANFALVAIDPKTKEKVSSGGFYQIATRSRRAPVRLEIVDAPIDSTLVLSSKNLWGPLRVLLHPTFQGRFSSEAFIGDTPLGILGYAENPSGNNRRRNLVWRGWNLLPGIRNSMSGEVWWGDRPQPDLSNPCDLFFSSVRLRSIIGQPLVSLHISNPNPASISAD